MEETIAASSAAADERERRIYEFSYLLAPTLDESGRSSALDALRGYVEGEQGTIINETYPELLDLAYAMDYQVAGKRTEVETAYFGWMFLELLPEDMEALKEKIDHDQNIVRYLLLTSTRELATAPSTINFKRGVASPQKWEVEEKEEETKEESEEEPKEEMSEEEVDQAIDDLVSEEEDPKV